MNFKALLGAGLILGSFALLLGTDSLVNKAEAYYEYNPNTGAISRPVVKQIPNDALHFNGHYYYIYSNVCNSWEEAEMFCRARGGHLAVINDMQENIVLFDYMKLMNLQNAYFGFTDREREGYWRWIDGTPVTFTNWAKGEPNNEGGREHYGMFYWKFQYEWNDGSFRPGTVNGGDSFICEWDSR